MAIKIVEAERDIYAIVNSFLADVDLSDTGRDRNKYEKARQKVRAALLRKFDKVQAKCGATNAS
jgi:hypothetical protein